MSDKAVLDSRRKAIEEEYFNRKNAEALEKIAASLGLESKACPVSGEPLKSEAFSGIVIHRSPSVNGVWIEADDLKVLLEMHQEHRESKWDLLFFQKLAEEARVHPKHGALKVAELDESLRLSPLSKKPMEKIAVQGVILDRCSETGGIWFDAGELSTFIENVNEHEDDSLGTWISSVLKIISG